MSTKRTTWQAVLIRTLCVLMLIQGTPLFALQEGAVTVRPDLPVWLQEIIPSWQWIVWQSDPSVSTSSTAPAGGSGSSSEPALSSAKVENPPLDWTTLPAATILAHPGAREATPQPTARQPARRFTKADREAGSAHNPSRERLPEGAQSKVAPRAEIPTKGIPSALVNLVEELHRSPSEIFAYVHDHFDFDPRWGAAKPPLQTLREKRGTAWELTWLLRDLLSAVGIDARFEWGEIELSPKGLESIAGIDDVYRAADLIATGGTPIRLIIEDDEVVAVRMRHVWLLAYLDYVPNRGRWVGEPDYWVRMGPTFKRYEVDEGARLDDAVPFALGDYLQSGSELSPRIAYEEALGVHLDENAVGVDTVDEIKRDRAPLKEDFVFVPGSLRGYVRNVEGASIGVPAEFMNRLELRLSEVGGGDLLTWSTDLAALYAKPLELSWTGASSADQAALDLNGGVFATPPYEVELAAKLRLGGAEVVKGDAVGSATDVLLTAVVASPDGEPITTEFTMFAGEHAVLAADLGLVPQEVVDLYARRQSEAPDAAEAERWALARASALYLRELGENNAHLSGLRWQHLVNLGNVVLAVQRGAVSRSPDGTPLTFSPAPPALDLGAMTLALFPPTGDPTSEVSMIGTMELLGSHASMLEAEVWMEVLGGEHVSAVPVLTRAVREGQELTRVDATNLDAALSAAELSAEAEASVEIGVRQGRIAWISESQIRVGTWDVNGYVLENPTTGAAGYLTTYERILEPLDANLVIHSPIDLGVITAPTDVVATIEGEAVDSWTLSTRPAGGESMTEIARGNGSIANATLGQFDPTLLLNGLHDLVLTARDAGGRSASEVISLLVEGNMKIGNFTLSFIDLSIPVAGLDLDIVRTYDSRDKEQGDFGFGWSLDIRRGSYVNNRPPGEGWRIDAGLLPCQSMIETKSHVTVIRLSDREVYRFRPRLDSPAPTLGGCFAEIGFDFVDGPVPGATLEILGNASVFWANASNEVREVESLEAFEPETVRLRTRDGRVFDLDLDTGVTALAEPSGNRITIDAAGIEHSAGVTLDFERDAKGRIVEIVDPLGQALVYGYDPAGDLALFTDREGHETRFSYRGDHLLEDVIDARGVRAARSEFDDDGRLVKVIDADGNATTFGHDLDARREVVTDRLGGTRILEYDVRGNVVREVDATGQVTLRSFDANDNLTSETDPLGKTTTFTYSVTNELLSLRDPLGNTTQFTYNAAGDVLTITDPRGNVIESTYDDRGNLLRMTDPSGAATVLTHDDQGNVLTETDALGHVTTRSYDGNGNLVREVDPLGVETTFTYNALGDRLTETTTRTTSSGVETLVTRFAYDGAGQIISRTLPDGSTYSTSYDGRGNVVREVDPLGRATLYTYDAAGRDVAVTYPDGTSETRLYDSEGNLVASTDRAGRITAFVYDAASRLVRTILPDGSTLESTYDPAGRLTSTTDAGGRTTTFTYDDAGRQVGITDALGQTTSATFDAAGNRLAVTDPAGETTRFEYDATGRLTRTIFPDGTSQQVSYDAVGQIVSTMDPAGVETTYDFDALGRLLQVEDALGGIARYARNEQGDLVSQTDALGRVTRFELDPLGRRTQRILPDDSRETWTYDAVGNALSHTDFAGRTTRDVYDENDRLVERSYPDGSQVTLSYTATGRRASAVDARGTTSYLYDTRDRLAELTYPDGRQLSYAYDSASNRTALTAHIAGQSLTTSYAYDPLDRLATVTDPDGGIYVHGYDPNGNRASLVQPNGTTTTYAYDSLNRLTELATVDAASAVLQSYTYTLDAAGRRTRIEEHGGTVRAHDFDVLGRLTEETVNNTAGLIYGNAFTYDLVGNRLSENRTAADGTSTVSTSTFDVRDRLEMLDGQDWTWDANGNLAAKAGEAEYAWDFEDQLREVILADGTVVRHVYDVDGIRVRTETTLPDGSSEAVDYLVDTSTPLPQVIAESSAKLLSAYYVRGDDLLAAIRPSGTRYYHADGLMSVRVLTDESGAVTDRYDYEAFGALHDRVGNDPNPFRFTGEAFDPNIGFAYHRARWMDPQAGRFTSIDPFEGRLREPVTLHKYLYAGNDPVNLVDPSGLSFGSAVGGLVLPMAVGALINGAFVAILSNHSPGTKEFWGEVLFKGAAVGALTAPVGGVLSKVLAPIAKLTIRPLLSLLGKIRRVILPGKGPAGKMLVRISRFFFNTNTRHPPVRSTFLGRTLQRLFPNIRWEQHHVFIQQSWTRVGSPNQMFDDLAANRGLKRLGNGLWNLLPIPRSLNQALGHNQIGTQMLATAYYSILVFGPWHTLANFFGD